MHVYPSGQRLRATDRLSDFSGAGERRDETTGGHWEQLTQSLSCFHKEERRAGRAESRNWLWRRTPPTPLGRALAGAMTRYRDPSLRDLLSLVMYSSQSNVWLLLDRWLSVMFMGQITHFWRRLPMKSWSPIRAKTLRQKTVRIITSDSFFTDWIRAPTMVFKPGGSQAHKEKRCRRCWRQTYEPSVSRFAPVTPSIVTKNELSDWIYWDWDLRLFTDSGFLFNKINYSFWAQFDTLIGDVIRGNLRRKPCFVHTVGTNTFCRKVTGYVHYIALNHNKQKIFTSLPTPFRVR